MVHDGIFIPAIVSRRIMRIVLTLFLSSLPENALGGGGTRRWSIRVWSIIVWTITVWNIRVWRIIVWTITVWSIRVWNIRGWRRFFLRVTRWSVH